MIARRRPRNGDIIRDCFNRFEFVVELFVKKSFNLSPACLSCFKWFIQPITTNANDNLKPLNDLYEEDSDEIMAGTRGRKQSSSDRVELYGEGDSDTSDEILGNMETDGFIDGDL